MATIPTPSFISIKEQSCVFNKDGCFKFFVPEKYFDTKLAEIRGEYVNLFGVCTYAIYDKNDKLISKLKNFNLPVMFLTILVLAARIRTTALITVLRSTYLKRPTPAQTAMSIPKPFMLAPLAVSRVQKTITIREKDAILTVIMFAPIRWVKQ